MGRNIKVVFEAFILVGFCCFLLFGVATTTGSPIPRTASAGVFMLKEGTTRRHEGFVFRYVSKRRIPNGPDPIHNRKIGNARQSPEQA